MLRIPQQQNDLRINYISHALGFLVVALMGNLAHAQGLPPNQAVNKFKVAQGLEISLSASEPDVAQPLSISFDHRGRMWVLQYLQYPIPNGWKAVEVDQYLRTKYEQLPPPPPHGPKGIDKITIYEDTDGDGRADQSKDFLSDLNLASGFAIGHDGVFVTQPPYLLFYPDRNQDDIPDSDPEVLLTGFGMDDAHAFANSLTWGPDGWLYGAQGSTVSADIRGIKFQQGIWRYHPISKEFELFAEGGGNTWGIDFDRLGNLFAAGNTVEPLCHHVQGAYYVKGFGKHGPLHNPHTYGYFQPVKHHGYRGDSLTGGFVLYQGGAFPSRFNNQCIAPNSRHSAERWSTLEVRGSTFDTRAAGDFITTDDVWFRPVDSTVGPDGALYVADWYDDFIAHWVKSEDGKKWYMPHRDDGRVWRVAPKGTKAVQSDSINLANQTSDELIDLMLSNITSQQGNIWYARQVRSILAQRRDQSVIPRLRKLVMTSLDQEVALNSLWALYLSGGINNELASEFMDSEHEYIRAWVIRLIGDKKSASAEIVKQFVELAQNDQSVIVRSQLACTAKRLPGQSAIPIVRELLKHNEDADDSFLPLLLWWVIEDKAISHQSETLGLLREPASWKQQLIQEHIIERLARRYAAEESEAGFAACAQILELSPSAKDIELVISGMAKALVGRNLESTPAVLISPLAELLKQQPDNTVLMQLAVRMGSHEGFQAALKMIEAESSSKDNTTNRVALIDSVGQSSQADSIPVFMKLLKREEPIAIHAATLSAIQRFDHPEIAMEVLEIYPRLNPTMHSRVIDLLTSRAEWSMTLLQHVENKKIKTTDVSVDQIRAMLLHNNEQISSLVSKHWGKITSATAKEKVDRIAALKKMVSKNAGNEPRGKILFEKQCAICHKFHDKGNQIGPDLTGSERKNLNVMLANIVDPSAMIRQQYISYIVLTVDGQVLNGLMADSNEKIITLLDAKNNRIVLDRDQIEEIKESSISLMPENILKELSEQQIQDLIHYLQKN